MTYGDFKDLATETCADKVLFDKAFDIAKNRKFDGYQLGLAWMVYKPFDKENSDSVIKNANVSNEELARELHKPIIRKFYWQYVWCRFSRYVTNI